MQTSGTFPQLSDGRRGKSRSKPARKPVKTEVEDGQGWTSRQPRPINAPKTTKGRRDLSHRKAAATMKKGC